MRGNRIPVVFHPGTHITSLELFRWLDSNMTTSIPKPMMCPKSGLTGLQLFDFLNRYQVLRLLQVQHSKHSASDVNNYRRLAFLQHLHRLLVASCPVRCSSYYLLGFQDTSPFLLLWHYTLAKLVRTILIFVSIDGTSSILELYVHTIEQVWV